MCNQRLCDALRRFGLFARRLLMLSPLCSTAHVNILNSDSAANENIITSCIMVAGIRTIENSCGTNKKQSIIPIMFITNTKRRYLLSGVLMCLSIIKPTAASTSVAAVATSLLFKPNTSPNSASEPTVTVSVSAAGRAILSTFLRK